MNFLGSLSNLLGIGNNTAQQAPAQPPQATTPQDQLQTSDLNRTIAGDLSRAPSEANTKPATQAPQGQGIEQQITSLFRNLFQTAPQDALNLLMKLMGPLMEMMNGQPSAQPAAQASPTPPTSQDLIHNFLNRISQAPQAEPAPAQTMPTGQATQTEQNPPRNLESLLQEVLSSGPQAETQNPPVQLAPPPTNNQPAQTTPSQQLA
jgi:hypothetical protein